jgi:hypothetical protein
VRQERKRGWGGEGELRPAAELGGGGARSAVMRGIGAAKQREREMRGRGEDKGERGSGAQLHFSFLF